jgi:hypothetical protein
MLNITPFRTRAASKRTTPAVAIIASRDRRAIVKHVLHGHANVVGELESSDRVHLLRAVEPDIVFIDTHSPAVNPLTAYQELIEAGSAARIVFLVDDPALPAPTRSMNDVPSINPFDARKVLADGDLTGPGPCSGPSPVAA